MQRLFVALLIAALNLQPALVWGGETPSLVTAATQAEWILPERGDADEAQTRSVDEFHDNHIGGALGQDAFAEFLSIEGDRLLASEVDDQQTSHLIQSVWYGSDASPVVYSDSGATLNSSTVSSYFVKVRRGGSMSRSFNRAASSRSYSSSRSGSVSRSFNRVATPRPPVVRAPLVRAPVVRAPISRVVNTSARLAPRPFSTGPMPRWGGGSSFKQFRALQPKGFGVRAPVLSKRPVLGVRGTLTPGFNRVASSGIAKSAFNKASRTGVTKGATSNRAIARGTAKTTFNRTATKPIVASFNRVAKAGVARTQSAGDKRLPPTTSMSATSKYNQIGFASVTKAGSLRTGRNNAVAMKHTLNPSHTQAIARLKKQFNRGTKIRSSKAHGADEYVSVYHGSIDHATKIRKEGFDLNHKGATYVSRDRNAALDAIGPNRYAVSQGQAKDPGLIESRIPKKEFERVMKSKGMTERKEYTGFYGSQLNSSEIQLWSKEAIDLFNKHIVK